MNSVSPDRGQTRISVVISNHNYGRFLRQAIASVTKQLGPGDEVIVVDDGSDDDSLDVLADLANIDQRIRVATQENAGQLAAVAHGVSLARNEIAALLDADDWYLASYLSWLRKLYRDRPETDFSFVRPQVHYSKGEPDCGTAAILARLNYPEGPVGATPLISAHAFDWVGSPTSGLALRTGLARHILDQFDPTDPLFTPHVDAVLVRCAALLGANRYAFAELGFVYRIHGKNHHLSFASRRQRWSQRQRRTRAISYICLHAQSPQVRLPEVIALKSEVLERAWPCAFKRRLLLGATYIFLGLVRSHGTPVDRFALITAVIRRCRDQKGTVKR